MRYIPLILIIFFVNKLLLVSQIQSDSSDALWSIVVPEAIAKEIDIGKEYIGSTKDSLLLDYIVNIGPTDIKIKKIYFVGADSQAFQIVSGLPEYTIAKGFAKHLEIRFLPSEVRKYLAQIRIISQSDTITYNIRGEGIRNPITLSSKIIDFGSVSIGSYKDTINAITIFNSSSDVVNIDSTRHNLPNAKDFSTLNGGESFQILANSVHKMDLRFKPSEIERTNGTLEFFYDGKSKPVVLQLFGRGVGSRVFVVSDSIYIGEKKKLKLKIDNSTLSVADPNIKSFFVQLSYNSSILTSTNSEIEKKISDSLEYISFIKKWDKNSELLDEFELIAGLGNAEYTKLKIEKFEWLDENGNFYNDDVTKINGNIKILGICEEGGKRLLNTSKRSEIMKISPNPSNSLIRLELNLVEKGVTVLKILNVSGQIIDEQIISDKIGTVNINFNAETFPNGTYYIHLQTPTLLKKDSFIISK